MPCPQRRLGIRGCAQRGLWPQTLCPTRIPPEYVSPGLYKRIQFVRLGGWPAHSPVLPGRCSCIVEDKTALGGAWGGLHARRRLAASLVK